MNWDWFSLFGKPKEWVQTGQKRYTHLRKGAEDDFWIVEFEWKEMYSGERIWQAVFENKIGDWAGRWLPRDVDPNDDPPASR